MIKLPENTLRAGEVAVCRWFRARLGTVLTQPRRGGILALVTDLPERATWYFEDYGPGLTVDCGSFSISEAEIIAFAKEYDPQPFHVDREAAAACGSGSAR